MNAIEIVLLLLGIVVFIASFIIPEKKSVVTEADKGLSEELVREAVNTEADKVKEQIKDMMDDTISYSIEKAERILERLTNEKMQAVDDYSDTVLAEISKNHKEVVFLYDMMNDKQEKIMENMNAADGLMNKMQDTIRDAVNVEKSQSAELKRELKEEKKAVPKKKAVESPNGPAAEKTLKAEQKKNDFHMLELEKVTNPKPIKEIDVNIGEDNKNKNEIILKMHEAGKSKMAIAKELGLGIGEVKLVIDLFEGI